MGKTYRRPVTKYEDEKPSGRSGRHSSHSNNRKTGGLRILNDFVEDDLIDDVMVGDLIELNIDREQHL